MIVLSCGHEVDDIDHTFTVITKCTDRQGEKALSYSVVCGPCEDRYRQAEILFDSDDQADVWLEKEAW